MTNRLVPDWFITFSQLGKGDARAIAITPLNLVLQLILLPLYLWLMADAQSPASWDWATLAPAVLIVLVPLAGAVLAERFGSASKAEGSRTRWPAARCRPR